MDEGLTHIFNKRSSKKSLGTKVVGRRVLAYNLVTSTNDLANFLAREGEQEGTIVFAKGQTHGRGRHGKEWASPEGGLYFSFILRPEMEAGRATRITLMAGWAVAKVLQEMGVGAVSIKWPNDVYLEGGKVCGILTEMSLAGDKVDYVVVGVGVNVNTDAKDLPKDAVSLAGVSGKSFDIEDLAHIIIRKIDEGYGLLREHKFFRILDDLRHASEFFLGSRVRVTNGERVMTGSAVDFDEEGGLVLRRDNGTQVSVAAGSLEIL